MKWQGPGVRSGGGASAKLGSALGVHASLCVCVNVRGRSPVSLGPEETGAIHTVCYSFDRRIGRRGGGWGGLFVVDG